MTPAVRLAAVRAVRLPTPADLAAARRIVREHLSATPVIVSEALGPRIVLKVETVQPTGSFKVRGALAVGAKLVSVFPDNAGTAFPSHQAVVVLFDAVTGAPAAILDGAVLTAERTAAASAVATRHLARAGSEVLAVLGTGVQARSHARCVPLVCQELREVRVWGRTAGHADALAAELSSDLPVPVTVASTLGAALEGADIVCATTHASEPVVRRALLAPGTHVNSVGFSTEGREVDAETVVDSFIAVESRASAFAPPPAGANDLWWPLRDGLITEDHIGAEVGELAAGTVPGRREGEQLTLYKSVGVAVEDLAGARLIVDTARARGLGRMVSL